jgi:hypothetical protein
MTTNESAEANNPNEASEFNKLNEVGDRDDLLDYKLYRSGLQEFTNAISKTGGSAQAIVMFMDFKNNHRTIKTKPRKANLDIKKIDTHVNKESPNAQLGRRKQGDRSEFSEADNRAQQSGRSEFSEANDQVQQGGRTMNEVGGTNKEKSIEKDKPFDIQEALDTPLSAKPDEVSFNEESSIEGAGEFYTV